MTLFAIVTCAFAEGRMDIHKNARLTPLRREEMAQAVVEGRLSQVRAA